MCNVSTDNISTNVTNTIPANMTNAISVNVTSTMSTNSDGKKVRYKKDCYIFDTVLLVIILLFIITIICYHYTKHKSKQIQWCTNNVKMENNKLKKVCIQNPRCYYFYYIIKIEDFDFDNILFDEKSCENIFIYDISYKTLIGAKPLCIRFDKVVGLEFMMELGIWYYLVLKNMMPFTIELGIL